MFILVLTAELLDYIKADAENNGYYSCQGHTGQGSGANGDAGGRYADTENNSSKHQINWLIVVNFGIYQNTDTRSGNYAEEQHGNTAHYRYRNTLNCSGQLAEAGQNNGKDCCATNNPGGEYLGNRQYTDVLAIGSIRGGAEETRQDGGDTVTDDGAVKSRILSKVRAYNVTGYKKMAYMLGDNNQSCRKNNGNGSKIEFWGIEGRQGKPWCLFNTAEVNNAKAQ